MNKTTQTEYLSKMNKFSKNAKLAEEKIKQKEKEIEALKEKIQKTHKMKSAYDWKVQVSGVKKDFDLITISHEGYVAHPELNHMKKVMNQ